MSSRLLQIQEMLKSEPLDSFLNYALALEYAKLNNIEIAINILLELLDRDSKYLGAYYQLGKWLEQIEQLAKAKNVYEKGILLAKELKNQKTLNELNEALWMIDE